MANHLSQPKPLAKCVDIKNVRDWVPEPARRRIGLQAAWARIKSHYCAALVGRSVCPIKCEECRETIVSMFDDFEDAQNPQALFTFRARDRAAKMIEKLIQLEKFPAMETRDPYDAMFHKKQKTILDLLEDYQ